jgi:hypothetical protein
VVHQGQGLPLRLEAGDHLSGVHAGLDELDSHEPLDRLGLLRQPDRAHAALAELFEQLVRPDHRAGTLGRGLVDRHRERQGQGFQEPAGVLMLGEQPFDPRPQGGVTPAGPVQERRPLLRVGSLQRFGE